MDNPSCPDHPNVELVFDAYYGAPGIGYSAHCPIDEKDFAVVGGSVHLPSEGAHILSAEDVI